jgi:SAM-dependent methyltransferase
MILDIGCGDGKLTDALSARCRSITGVDASTNMINSMLAAYPHIPAFVLNCSDDLLPAVKANSPFPPGSASVSHPTSTPEALHSEQYTAIFSNAALHWILAPPAARRPFFQACYALLKPGGRLVAEAGAAGNVAEVHGAIVHELLYGQGISLDKVRAQDPWWFGSLQEYRSLVEAAGLEWIRGEVELRPTRLTEGPEGGVKGWYVYSPVYP